MDSPSNKHCIKTGGENRRAPEPPPSPSPVGQSPAVGCRIAIRYRKKPVKPKAVEGIPFEAVSEREMNELFRSACKSIPEQFAGIVSPEQVPRYEIALKHWRFGEVRFLFSCTKPREISKNIEIFRRRCTVDGNVSGLPENLQEQAARRRISVKGRLGEQVAEYFRIGRGCFVEVSWPINQRGKPKPGTGRFRYPLGYPQILPTARTGFGAYFNAPLISDNKRHGPALNEVTNKKLREACESLLVDTLSYHVIPDWKHDGLIPLLPCSDMDDDTLRPLLAKIVKRAAIPVLSWRDAAKLSFKGRWKKVEAALRRTEPVRNRREPRRYRFVVPYMAMTPDTVHPALSLLCPRSEKQLDSRVHPEIIRLLADCNTPGFKEDFVTFDENDVFARITNEGNQYFGAIPSKGLEFSEPVIGQAYLDVIRLALENGEREDAGTLFESLLMPDTNNEATFLSKMYTSASLPSDIPGLRLPPTLHSELVTHPLLKKQPWKRREYTMARFLEGGNLQSADQDTRRQFWRWLCRNKRHVRIGDLRKFAKFEIWPDIEGNLCRISDLCEPRSRQVCEVLAGFIRRPNKQVLRSGLVKTRGKALTSIRRIPDSDQVVEWFEARLCEFTFGEEVGTDAKIDLVCLEKDLSILLRDRATAPLLKEAGKEVLEDYEGLPALAQDGSIRPRNQLVVSDRGNNRLALPKRFLLKDYRNTDILDRLVPALGIPNAEMLLEAFSEDSRNLRSLQARLKCFFEVVEQNGDEHRRLTDMHIIPIYDELYKPSQLVLPGHRGNFWGEWKIQISVAELSQDEQKRYLSAGVASAYPNEETSQAFFRWLVDQDPAVIARHIPCVLRHILHSKGPVSWAETCKDTAFIPAEGRDGLRLVTLRTALRKPVFLNDAGDIGKEILQKDPRVLLVVDSVKGVKEPVTEILKRLEIRSLRSKLNEPKKVSGIGNPSRVDKEASDMINALLSRRVRDTMLKRLKELEIKRELVHNDWHNRLSQIKDICLADTVEVCHHFRNKAYYLKADAGFDPGSGIYWVRRDRSGREALFRSIAKDLFFKQEAPKSLHYVLSGIAELMIDDPTFGQPSSPQAGPNDDRNEDSYAHDPNEPDAEPGEAIYGHSPYEPDAKRNIPSPGPIPAGPENRPDHPHNRTRAIQSKPDREHKRSTPALEREQVENLKSRQYAYHCQMCLCKMRPEQLAPVGSYIENAEVRLCVIEAHHVDPVSGGGARHAKNIILLCKYHHDKYGRQLSRRKLVAALVNIAEEINIRFGKMSVEGQKVKYLVESTGEDLEFFFTKAHANMWLS